MTYQTNPLLVSAALEMALQAYDLGARRSGRTTARFRDANRDVLERE